jgi:hypothetical protein
MHYRFHRVVTDAAQFRMMQRIYDADPKASPRTVELLLDCLRTKRDDDAFVREMTRGYEPV